MTRDTAGTPGGDGGARGPRRPSDRRSPHAAGPPAADEPAATGGQISNAWSTGLTGPQRVFPVWDGEPGYEFEAGRSSRRPPPGPGPAGAGQGTGSQGEPPRFRYTPTVSRPQPTSPAWPQDDWTYDDRAQNGWSRDDRVQRDWHQNDLDTPGFEFDTRTRLSPPGPREPRGPREHREPREHRGPREPRETWGHREPRVSPAAGGARSEWARLLRSFLPEPVKRNWFAEFRSALNFRGAGTKVIIPILAMMVFGVAVVVIAGANGSNAGPTPPPAALGFPPATLAGNAFAAAPNGRGISQTLGQVTSDGAEIVAVGSQQGARIGRAQFFVSSDGGRTWSMGHVQTPAGGPPPPSHAARFVAGGHGGWVALGPGSIWTSPDGRTWTLASTAGLPLRPGDQINVLTRTADGFIAAGSNVPGGNQAGATPVVFRSADGITWQRLGADQLRLPVSGLARVLDLRYAAVFANRILVAGDVSATQSIGKHTVTVQTSAAWLSGDGGTTWTLAVPPGPTGTGNSAAHGAGTQISGLAATGHGFIALRPATAAGRPAVDVYRSANGTAWTFAATLGTPAGFAAGPADGTVNGAVVTGRAGSALIAFVSADGASWRQRPAFGSAAAQDVSGVATAPGGTVVTAGTTIDDPDSRQPVLTVLAAQDPAKSVDIAAIPGADDPQLAVNDVAAGNGLQVAVGSANGYPAAWVSANGGSTWTRASGQTPAVLDRPGVQQLTSVTGGAGGWLAVGGVIAVAPEHPVVLISGDGTSWASADREPAFTAPGLVTEQAASGQAASTATTATTGYVIVGYQSVAGRTIAAAWWSAGLTGWQRAGDGAPGALDGPPPQAARPASTGSKQMLAVTAGPRGFVAVGAAGNAGAAWTSANGGRTWTQQNVPLPYGATRAVLQRVTSNGRTVVAVGTALTTGGQQLPFAASSADGGITWAESILPVPQGRAFLTALTAEAGGFLATGTFGSTPGHQDVVVWTSAGGSAWKAVTPTGRGLSGTGIQAITSLDIADHTLTGVGFTATPGGEQPVFWQSPER